MNAPEGFIPYEMKTRFGTLTLPDRKCTVCIATWSFFSCTMCCFTQTLEQDARPIVEKMNEELNEGDLMLESYNDWYPVVIMERGAGRNKFLKELKCEHYDGEKCTLFQKCVFPYCRYYVTVEEC